LNADGTEADMTSFAIPTRWRRRAHLGSLVAALDKPVAMPLLLGGWSLLLFVYGLGVGDFWRTESLRAVIAREMLETGDWIVPRLYGEPLFTKPPGMYLAIVLCSLPLGYVTEFSARLPSALAACACVAVVAWYFTRRLGRRAGLAAGLMLPMAFMWIDKSTAAEIDMLQTAFVTASILFFLRAVERPGVSSQWSVVSSKETDTHAATASSQVSEVTVQGAAVRSRESDAGRATDYGLRTTDSFVWWLAACLCMAGGVLTKWTAPQFFYGTALPYLWWTGRLRLLVRWPHLVSAGIAASIVIAWIIAASLRAGWDSFMSTVLWEGLSRLLPGYNTWRPYPWGEALFHPLKIVLNTLPWSALALLALRPGFTRRLDAGEKDLLVALHCWVWPQILFWSLVTEHTPRHSFPLFPGMAGLAVLVWHVWHTRRLPWRMPRLAPARLLAGAVCVWLLVKIAYVEGVVPHRDWRRQTSHKAAVLAAFVPPELPLHLFTLRNEGLMFYCGRSIARADGVADLPPQSLCVLSDAEWSAWDHPRRLELLQRLRDEQGDPIYLVCVE
jgi:4-amino-4-deoxy-L-arabinose transferase-like glycosyltransferase